MTCPPAPACTTALFQASARWPQRSRLSDGICPGPDHPTTGDHPAGNAFDLTHDPAHGCDAHGLAEFLRVSGEVRSSYIISNRRICNPGGEWRSYNGSSPHDKHIHVSIWPEDRDDTSPWWPPDPTPDPTPKKEAQMLRVPARLTKYNGNFAYDWFAEPGERVVLLPENPDGGSVSVDIYRGGAVDPRTIDRKGEVIAFGTVGLHSFVCASALNVDIKNG